MITYLIFGLGFYVGAAVKAHRLFANVGTVSILKGLFFGILLWPLALGHQLYMIKKSHG